MHAIDFRSCAMYMARIILPIVLAACAWCSCAHPIDKAFAADTYVAGSVSDAHLLGAQSDSKATESERARLYKNAKAHAAYIKHLDKTRSDLVEGKRYKFVDLTGDGIDEMVIYYWPSVYTVSDGGVKRVLKGETGGHIVQGVP